MKKVIIKILCIPFELIIGAAACLAIFTSTIMEVLVELFTKFKK